MKPIKAFIALLIALIMTICFAGCFSKSPSTDKADYGKEAYGPAVVRPGDGYGGAADMGGYYGYKEADYATADGGAMYDGGAGYEGGVVETPKENYNQRPAGLITAACHDDNAEYEYFLTLFKEGKITENPYYDDYYYDDLYPDDPIDSIDAIEPDDKEGAPVAVGGEETPVDSVGTEAIEGQEQNEEEIAGKFYRFLLNDRWGFYANKRVTVRVKDGEGSAVVGAKVSYNAANQDERFAVTDANGVAYIFPDDDNGSFTVKTAEGSFAGAYDEENKDVTVETGSVEKANVIKLMFVVDVTGSMDDELDYLTTELEDVIERVAQANDGVRIDLALLFYRDDGDNEKFAYYDFLTVTEDLGLKQQLKYLSVQRATGGGDFPEALDEALLLAAQKDWSNENSTKIIFNVYDAPPHSTEKNKSTYEQAVRLAAKKGIRINPVLCSGANTLCEYLARETAIHTQGKFIYVTDDSGIGGSHYDPDIPNDVVEKLNEMMVRLINGFHTGTFADPVDWRGENRMKGSFYDLKELYDSGELSIDDIKNVAYYYREAVVGGGMSDEERLAFTPAEKSPETMDGVADKIIHDYRIRLENNDLYAYKKIGDIAIANYYGCYNGYYVFNITAQIEGVNVDPYFADVDFDGFTFKGYSKYCVKCWKAY